MILGTWFGALLTLALQLQTQAGVVSGQITNAGGSVAQVRVVAVEAGDPAAVIADNAAITSLTQTDDTGRFRLEGIPPGRYYIMAGLLSAPTFYPGSASLTAARVVEVGANTTITNIDFTIQRPVGVKISGRVEKDPRAIVYSDSPRILLWQQGRGTAYEAPVDANGSFEFTRVEPGNYVARVYPGLIDYTSKAIEVGDKDISDLRLPFPFTVQVKVTLRVAGAIPRIALSFSNATGTTFKPELSAALGSKPVEGIEEAYVYLLEGDYKVALSQVPQGYELESIVQGQLDILKESLRISATNTPQITVTLKPQMPQPWVKVRGRVTSTIRGTEARLTLSGAAMTRTLETTLNQDGTFEFGQVLPGEYRLRLVGAQTVSTLLGSKDITVSHEDLTGVELNSPAFQTINGKVNAENGGPFPRFRLTLQPTVSSALPISMTPTISADGKFSVVLPEGNYGVAIDNIPPGYRIKSLTYGDADVLSTRTLRIAASPQALTITTDFTLPNPWAVVSGRVVGKATQVGLAITGTLRTDPQTSVVAADGSFAFSRVAPGTYSLRTFPTAANSKTITVDGVDIRNVEIVIPEEQTISGDVQIEGDSPLSRLTMTFSRTNSTTIVTGRAGILRDKTFKMTLPEGEFRFRSAETPPNYRIVSLKYGTVDALNESFIVDRTNLQELHVRFELVSPQSKVAVSGKISGLENLGRSPRLILSGGLTQVSGGIIRNDGTFSIPGVPSGNYTLQALAEVPSTFVFPANGTAGPATNSFPSSNVLNLEVQDKNIQDVQLNVPPMSHLKGRILFDKKTSAVDAVPLIFASDIRTFTTYIHPGTNDEFEITVPEGTYKLSVNGVSGYRVQSLRLGEIDLLNEQAMQIQSERTGEILITLAPK